MNKELEALETIENWYSVKSINDLSHWLQIRDLLPDECAIIEKGLKRLEELENDNALFLGTRQSGKILTLLSIVKSLKALEIIKRNPIEVINLIDTYSTYREMMEDYYAYDNEIKEIKSEEEFNLLKEVLKNE